MSLCAHCRQHLLSRLRASPKPTLRYFSKIPNSLAQPSSESASSSTSTPGVAQPFSVPQLPPTAATKSQPPAPNDTQSKIQSSIPGGQELRGVAYLKARPNILAKEDDEYPPWLWTLLEDGKSGTGEKKVDLAALTKKQRAKYDKQQEKIRKSLPTQIPVHEQSKDISQPGDDPITSLQRRQEIVKSSRAARRKGIKENNFLRSM